jgi:hypothetical protein
MREESAVLIDTRDESVAVTYWKVANAGIWYVRRIESGNYEDYGIVPGLLYTAEWTGREFVENDESGSIPGCIDGTPIHEGDGFTVADVDGTFHATFVKDGMKYDYELDGAHQAIELMLAGKARFHDLWIECRTVVLLPRSRMTTIDIRVE